MSENRRRIIGVTGPTGAGKSTVVAVLKESFGFRAIDTDKLARLAVNDKNCALSLKKAFGNDIYEKDGSLNRALLASRAFQNDEKTALLNSITHPVIIQMLLEEIENAPDDVTQFVIDVPLLYESGLDKICDFVFAVTAPYQTRLSRIRKRDGLTIEQAKLRMARQKKNKFYESRADYVIDGRSSNLEEDIRTALLKLEVIR